MRRGDPERGAKARERGRAAEWLAAFYLMAKGYQILGFRLRTPQGEIDLLARRGRVLAVVEVKRRASRALALDAIGFAQRERLLRAGRSLAATRPALRQLALRIDLIALAPKTFPRHLRNIVVDDDRLRL
jgi:putative endonuclease